MKDLKNKISNLREKGILKKVKKVIIISLSCIVVLGGVSLYAGYNYIKSNINYSQKQCEEIALKKVPGTIIKTEKDIDKHTLSLTYDFQIKAQDNVLNEIEVDSKNGAITKINQADNRISRGNDRHENM